MCVALMTCSKLLLSDRVSRANFALEKEGETQFRVMSCMFQSASWSDNNVPNGVAEGWSIIQMKGHTEANVTVEQ